MSNRIVFGYLYDLQSIPLKNNTILFKLLNVGGDEILNALHEKSEESVLTNELGYFEIDLWVDEESTLPTRYRMILPSKQYIEFNIPLGNTPIEVTKLLTL